MSANVCLMFYLFCKLNRIQPDHLSYHVNYEFTPHGTHCSKNGKNNAMTNVSTSHCTIPQRLELTVFENFSSLHSPLRGCSIRKKNFKKTHRCLKPLRQTQRHPSHFFPHFNPLCGGILLNSHPREKKSLDAAHCTFSPTSYRTKYIQLARP